MRSKKIEKITIGILEELGINEIPIPVAEIAKKKGLEIKLYDLGKNVSGLLVIDEGKGTIGVNPTEPKTKQRFTIAHELGHYEMHKFNSSLFIDKKVVIFFKAANVSRKELKEEFEANAFATSLLIPEKFLKKEIKNNKLNLCDENSLKKLATLFNVSVPTMTLRIADLNLFRY